jgi:hypothetical protein
VTAVSFGINSDQVGDIWALDVGPVQHLLPEVVVFIGEDAPVDSDPIVLLLADEPIGHLGEPPNS